MSRLDALRNRHAGQRCVVMANGPSLNRMDLGVLRGEVVIGLNKIFLGIKRFGIYPSYYVAVNPKVLAQSADAIRQLNCVKFLGFHAAAAGLAEDALTHIVDTRSPPSRFSADLAHGMHEGWTVTHAALQVAYHLGFSEVVLVGLDHRYQCSGAPNKASFLRGDDPNHFCPEYFGNQEWDHPDLERAEESYRAARQAFETDGRRIIDATVDGACEVFEKLDLNSALARNRQAAQ